MGLAGLSDLVLTASSLHSRNFSFGYDLGQGKAVSEAGGGKLAEGVFTARILDQIARARGVDMPIVAAMAAILDGKLSVDDAVNMLMNRPIKEE